MSIPLFYTVPLAAGEVHVVLNEENSRHIVQVLRMKDDEEILLTDGWGIKYTAVITEAHKKKCGVRIIGSHFTPRTKHKVTIAVSPLKNSSRFEWFLEKAAEMGVSEIIPLMCTRTEKQNFRLDRMKGILISAMLQSQQTYAVTLQEPVNFKNYLSNLKDAGCHKFIAHCEEEKKTSLKEIIKSKVFSEDVIILIGPEGDFTHEENTLAVNNGFEPVSLGNTRLRTETAAMVSAALLCIN